MTTRALVLSLFCTLAFPAPGAAEEETEETAAPAQNQPARTQTQRRYNGPFAQGRVRVSVVAGGGNEYLVLGGVLGYYVLDGLELGLGSEFWLIGSPRIITVSPQVRYVLHFVPVLKPYAGVFYQRAFVNEGFDDYDSVGGRVGAFWVSGGGSYVGAGAVFEQTLDCPAFRDCFQVAPEFVLALSF